MDVKVIGKKLRNLRKKQTAAEVAREVKISTSSLLMYERGERIPRDEIKERLAAYYGVTVASIFFSD